MSEAWQTGRNGRLEENGALQPCGFSRCACGLQPVTGQLTLTVRAQSRVPALLRRAQRCPHEHCCRPSQAGAVRAQGPQPPAHTLPGRFIRSLQPCPVVPVTGTDQQGMATPVPRLL